MGAKQKERERENARVSENIKIYYVNQIRSITVILLTNIFKEKVFKDKTKHQTVTGVSIKISTLLEHKLDN